MTTFFWLAALSVVAWYSYNSGLKAARRATPDNNQVYLFEVETVDGVVMAYDFYDSRFICQGSTAETVADIVRQRIPGYTFYIAMGKKNVSV
jgi:hypothetical protein